MVEQKQSSDNQALAREMNAYLQAYLEAGFFMGSVLVANGDDVLLSQGFGMANLEHNVPNIAPTKFRLASVSKQFTATAIMQLQEAGLLDVNNSISRYLPDYPNGNSITIHHLLNHTSGIPSFTGFPDYVEKMRIKKTTDELIAWFSDKPLEFTPGEQFEYSNSGYVVLTKIIETISGQSYPEYLQQHIFAPLGMNDSGYDHLELVLPNRASGYVSSGEGYKNAAFIDMSLPSGAGGLYSTVEDLYKWDRALYIDSIINESSKNAMFAPTVKNNLETNPETYCAYGWFSNVYCGRDRVFHHGGINGFSTSISRYLNEKAVIIVLCNLVTAASSAIANDLAAILFGESYEMPKKRQAIEVDPAIYEAYVGEYQLSTNEALTITTEAQRIFTQFAGEKIMEIFPESETKFFLKVVDAQFTFIVSETDKASQVILHQNGIEQVATRI